MKNWDQINEKLDFLRKRQIELNLEIERLVKEISYLKNSKAKNEDEAEKLFINTNTNPIISPKQEALVKENTLEQEENVSNKEPIKKEKKIDYERLIGENIINKIGILVLIIGVLIGAKFAIDRDLISPLFRIIFGYGLGLGILLVSQKLMKKYETFSSVLLAGASAILYFVSFFAYDEYKLIGIEISFVLLFLVTLFTSIAAVKLDKKIIASLGLIGAYLIPFLLSTGSNNYHFLFCYILIVNSGLFFILLKKDWKIVKSLSLVSTWLICLSWFFLKFENEYFNSVIIYFSAIYFVFNFSFVAQKVIHRTEFKFLDFLLIGLNPVIYFFIGLWIIDSMNFSIEFSGIFSIILALFQIPNILLLKRANLKNSNPQIFFASIIILFSTIAVPLQLDGVWISVFWAMEAVIFYIIWGKNKSPNALRLVNLFLSISFFNLLINGFSYQNSKEISNIIFNTYFLNNFIVTLISAYIVFEKKFKIGTDKVKFFRIEITQLILGFIIFFTGVSEIAKFWNIIIHENTLALYQGYYNENIFHPNFKLYKALSLNIFYLVFLISTFKFLDKRFNIFSGFINIFLIVLIVYLILFGKGLYILSELRVNYIESYNSRFFEFSKFSLCLRYFFYLIYGFAVAYILKSHSKLDNNFKKYLSKAIVFFILIIWFSSSELLNIIDLLGLDVGYKGPLSILWGVLGLSSIIYGFKKDDNIIRWAGIILLGLTLFKLFILDLTSLSNISKTIIFISVGIILLVVSFIYNKIKKDGETK